MTTPNPNPDAPLDYTLEPEVVCQGYDRQTEWFQPRAAVLPGGEVILTMTRSALWGSDIFLGIWYTRSRDGGRTWTEPAPIEGLDRRPLADGYQEALSDFTGALHHATGKVLYTGGTTCYEPGAHGVVSADNSHPRDVAYVHYDPGTDSWSDWRRLELPDRDRFFWAMASCCDRVDLADGQILQPIYTMDRDGVGGNFWDSCFRAAVLRLAFDGDRLRCLEVGDELVVPEPRGFCEPSLTRFGDRFYLTLRNDVRGYVARSRDGLHFEDPVPWRFDDGQELGSYNTQQHWVTHSDGLFLAYTRRGADNDHVIRHRAPLFVARVDPERLCVQRHTERVVVPNRGAQLGNFGTAAVSAAESWVVTSECMQGDAEDPHDLERTERRGADARVWIARLRWNRPNRLVADDLAIPGGTD